jgi:hypothetical protein
MAGEQIEKESLRKKDKAIFDAKAIFAAKVLLVPFVGIPLLVLGAPVIAAGLGVTAPVIAVGLGVTVPMIAVGLGAFWCNNMRKDPVVKSVVKSVVKPIKEKWDKKKNKKIEQAEKDNGLIQPQESEPLLSLTKKDDKEEPQLGGLDEENKEKNKSGLSEDPTTGGKEQKKEGGWDWEDITAKSSQLLIYGGAAAFFLSSGIASGGAIPIIFGIAYTLLAFQEPIKIAGKLTGKFIKQKWDERKNKKEGSKLKLSQLQIEGGVNLKSGEKGKNITLERIPYGQEMATSAKFWAEMGKTQVKLIPAAKKAAKNAAKNVAKKAAAKVTYLKGADASKVEATKIKIAKS